MTYVPMTEVIIEALGEHLRGLFPGLHSTRNSCELWLFLGGTYIGYCKVTSGYVLWHANQQLYGDYDLRRFVLADPSWPDKVAERVKLGLVYARRSYLCQPQSNPS